MMNLTRWVGGTAVAVALLLGVSAAMHAEEVNQESPEAKTSETAADSPAEVSKHALSLPEAKQRARLMHRIYASTLESMHRHYFHGDRSIVPARAMEDIFSELNEETDIEARWISVNTKAMSVDHEPETKFEKQAASEIADGKEVVENVEQGFYQQATPIPLAGGCVGCHMGTFGPPPKKPRFAGLVIRVPIQEE